MSYRLKVGLKNVRNGDEAFAILHEYKAYILNRLPELAKYYFRSSPVNRIGTQEYQKMSTSSRIELVNKIEDWAMKNCFQSRFFYNQELQILGITFTHEEDNFFDKVIYFQDSSDQNYDRSAWEGIPNLEAIYKEAMSASDKEIKKIMKLDNLYEADEEIDWEYYRQTCAYQKIWDKLKKDLLQENYTLYMNLITEGNVYLLEPFINTILKMKEAEEVGGYSCDFCGKFHSFEDDDWTYTIETKMRNNSDKGVGTNKIMICKECYNKFQSKIYNECFTKVKELEGEQND